MWFVFSVFFFKQTTAYEMRISDWSSDVCSSDLVDDLLVGQVLGLLRHQRVLAVAVAIFLQRVREVVVVLAAELRIAGVDGRVAFLAVAVHAGLAGGLALGVGELLAGIDVALGQACGRDGVAFGAVRGRVPGGRRSEAHTSELQSLMRISYAVFCLKKKKKSI